MIILLTRSMLLKRGKEVITQEKTANLLGMCLDDNQQWKSHISGTGGVISNLNKRLYKLRRIKNHLNDVCLKRVADSIFTSKIRYGLQLVSKVKTQNEDSTSKLMKDLQKTQNKMLRFLNKSRVSDKINTKTILDNLNMLSVNQINAQIKLTETWKALNGANSSLCNIKKKVSDSYRTSRSLSNGDIIEEGYSVKSLCTFQNYSTRLWNKAPSNIKLCSTIYTAKKEIKKFVKTLPV